MKKGSIAKTAERELEASGFATVTASNMHTLVDVIAARRGQKFIIKVAQDIDSVTRQEANALFRLARFLDAEPIILGSVAGTRKLKENVSHYRFEVRCISPETLPNLIHGEAKLLASRSFGIKATIDNVRLRNLRKISNMQVTELARQTGLSKSTLYKHEEEPNYAAVSTIQKIEKALNSRIGIESELPRGFALRLKAEKFERTGMQALELHSAPFDIVAKDRNYFEISFDANFRTLAKRAAFFSAIRETFENNYPFFLSFRKKGKMLGVPILGKKEIERVRSEDELLDLVY